MENIEPKVKEEDEKKEKTLKSKIDGVNDIKESKDKNDVQDNAQGPKDKKDDEDIDEDDNKEPKNKKSEDNEEFLKAMRKIMGFKEKPTIPKYPINKKAQNKFLKDKPFSSVKKISKSIKDYISSEEDKKEITKKITYPSGITKEITKNEKNVIITETINYEGLKEIYINNLKENIDTELKKLIENSFLLYNRKQIIRNIVKKPLSTKALEEKILLWKYYIKDLSKEEKAHLLRKLLYFIGKFSEDVYNEFIKIKEISQAYLLLTIKGIIDKTRNRNSIYLEANKFYMINSLLGYDEDGNPKKKDSDMREDISAILLLGHILLNAKEELNGTGFGYVFLKELKDIFEMYTNSSFIFESIFYGCYDIFEKEDFIFSDKPETYRILWNYFGDYFIDDSFVINFLIQLKYVFGIYRQDEVIKYMHDLVLVRWNVYGILDTIKKKLEIIIGPEEIMDEKEKVEKMDNIDDVMKYIEGDEKPKKKKKKKKNKNKNKINMLDDLLNKNENQNKIEDCIDLDDGLSIISEADSVLDCFKNDIMAETEYNTGNKVIPILSSEFLNKFKK